MSEWGGGGGGGEGGGNFLFAMDASGVVGGIYTYIYIYIYI